MRCKKGFWLVFILLALALLSLQAVSASEVIVFDGKVLPGYEYNSTGGHVFSVDAVAPYEKIAIDLPGEGFIVDNNSCSKGKRFEACYNGANFKGYNYSLPDRVVYEIKVKIALVGPDMKLSKHVNNPVMDVGGETTVQVNVTNAGKGAGTVYFRESVPIGLRIVEVPGQPCELSFNNSISLSADLDSGQFKSCIYRLYAERPGAFSLVSRAEFDLVKREVVEASVGLSVNKLPLAINITLPEKVPLGERFNATILLSSTAELEDLSLAVFFPKYLKVRSLDGKATVKSGVDGSNVSYGGPYSKLNGSLAILVGAEAVGAGSFSAMAGADWRFNGLKQGLIVNLPSEVTMSKPYFRLAAYDSQKGVATVDIVNPAHIGILNVSVLSSSFSGSQERLLQVESIGSLSHVAFEVILEQQGEGGNYSGAISYYTPYRQMLTAKAVFAVNSSAADTRDIENKSGESLQLLQQQGPEPAQEETTQAVAGKQEGASRDFKKAAAVAGAIVITIFVILFIKSRKERMKEDALGGE